MTEKVVLSDIDGRGVASVTINRPSVNNAYNAAVIEGLAQAFDTLAANSAVRVAILRGNGKHFQAGADLIFIKELSRQSAELGLAFSRLTFATVDALRRFKRPTIALVQGGCFGGGVGLVAACDIVIASSDAIFSLTEVRWGITPAPIMGLITSRLGPRALGRYALTGERFGAAQAHRIGLVHEVCAPGMLDEAAAPVVETLLMNAPEATARTKELIEESLLGDGTFDFGEAMAREGAQRRHMPEAQEGLTSFAEKRPPSWYPPKQS
ncbi:MAG TPA: enoyl-CoA hydratase-related protein [Stellaceae bacterium]|nr:enoyl-CoA hydratase-related protein [Stellaceae bacterium]